MYATSYCEQDFAFSSILQDDYITTSEDGQE